MKIVDAAGFPIAIIVAGEAGDVIHAADALSSQGGVGVFGIAQDWGGGGGFLGHPDDFGAEVLAAGVVADDLFLSNMRFWVKGVEGSLPTLK